MADTELKVVVSLAGGRARIGVQEKDSDPVMEMAPAADLGEALAALPALLERARARWAQAPKNPAYQRPAPPPPAPRPAVAARTASGCQEPREGQMQPLM